MLMCVWQSNRQDAEATIAGDGGANGPSTAAKSSAPKTRTSGWPSSRGRRSGTSGHLPPRKRQGDVVLDWKPPFAAKWRADWLGEDGAANSWFFQKSGRIRRAHADRRGRRVPVPARRRSATVQLQSAGGRSRPAAPRPLVVYAMDRSRATPLTAFCPIDVLRSTLGVGPCQYILQTEGLRLRSQPHARQRHGRSSRSNSAARKRRRRPTEIREPAQGR